jgi:AcrR family transcriptional regulator
VSHATVDRDGRRTVDKPAARRDELAQAALQTLSELGYARTSLREIAQNSAFSHGVLHYYFTDKVDLITHCVRLYKAQCVRRYDVVVETSRTRKRLESGFAAAMAKTLVEETGLHRLWYDLRSQSMFEPSFREDVAAIDASLETMVWQVLSRYAELSGSALAVSPKVGYAMFDGLFQSALLAFVAGDETAPRRLRQDVHTVLRHLVPEQV